MCSEIVGKSNFDFFFNWTHLSLGFSSELLKPIKGREAVYWHGRRVELDGGGLVSGRCFSLSLDLL